MELRVITTRYEMNAPSVADFEIELDNQGSLANLDSTDFIR